MAVVKKYSSNSGHQWQQSSDICPNFFILTIVFWIQSTMHFFEIFFTWRTNENHDLNCISMNISAESGHSPCFFSFCNVSILIIIQVKFIMVPFSRILGKWKCFNVLIICLQKYFQKWRVYKTKAKFDLWKNFFSNFLCSITFRITLVLLP